MEIIHAVNDISIKKNANENVGFLMTSKNGSYCSFFNVPSSRYQGLFYFDESTMNMYKFIENIEIDENEISRLKNKFYCIERRKSSITESFFMPKNSNSLIYELNEKKEINLLLDCKNAFDNRAFGRHYDIFEEKGCIVVKFTKRTDAREDFSDALEEFILYLAVKSDDAWHKKNNEWVERHYAFDEERNSQPFKRYVYNALRLKGAKFVFSMSRDKKDAVKECNYVFDNINTIKNKEKEYFFEILKNESMQNIIKSAKISKEIKVAYINAINSLNNLKVNKNNFGIFAGLPWFFQFWFRDTLISFKALSKIDKEFAEKLLFNYLNKINNNGRLHNLVGSHSSASLGNADSHGWLFFRCRELIANKNYKNPKFIYKAKKSLEKSLNGLLKFHTKEGFEINGKLETWMDTDYGNDVREGIRIEMQALRLNMYKLTFELTQNQKYRILENILKNKVREFWNETILADGLNDSTIRPNIFLAAYIYPELLANKEWQICFENALDALWLDWGGLSTIDKNNKLFIETDTGEDVKSYHRGNSWFWLNNLAALTLNKINKIKFKKNIKKIINASTEEILWKGCIGCHSELSSAKHLESRGCFNQAWSNAMYIEMVDEILD